MSGANLQTEWARLLIDGFVAAGVRDAVISPGSRSTPFVWAVDQRPELRTWDVVDERSAAFFALGQAKRSGEPSLLICTSGSAVANYLPAVVEAANSYCPLLVLSADRPPELAHAGGNQTIDQLKLFGDQVRAFYELGGPTDGERALAAVRRTAVQAAAASRWPTPGPVHVNARASKPLEPRPAAGSAAEQALADRVSERLCKPATTAWHPRAAPDDEAIATLTGALLEAERGLVVCGPVLPAARAAFARLAALTERRGLVLYAEATSQHRFARTGECGVVLDGLDLAVRNRAFRELLEPDLVLQIGPAPVSTAWQKLIDSGWGGERWVLAEHGWQDPASTASHLLIADTERTLDALLERLPAEPVPRSAWHAEIARAAEVVSQRIDAVATAGDLTEATAVRSVADTLPAGSLLGLGNSLPVREIDWYVGGLDRDLTVWHQRGASGIDGVVSGFAGAASRHPQTAGLLIGDLSFLHDLSGVALLSKLEAPTAVVVLNNHGGRIFEQLPLATTDTGGERTFEHWTTPHDLRFEAIAEMHDLRYRRPADRVELDAALTAAYAARGATLIEVELPADSARREIERLRAAVDEALGRLPGG